MMEGKETAHLVAWVSIFICIALVLHKDLLLQKAEVFIGEVAPSVQAASASLLFTLALLKKDQPTGGAQPIYKVPPHKSTRSRKSKDETPAAARRAPRRGQGPQA